MITYDSRECNENSCLIVCSAMCMGISVEQGSLEKYIVFVKLRGMIL